MLEENRSDKVLDALNWQPQTKISQESFFSAVQDNIDALGMTEQEAIDSVLEEFSLQKVNASDVVLVTDADQLRQHPTNLLLKEFRGAACAGGQIEELFAQVSDTLTTKDDRDRQQSLGVAFQNNILPTFLSDIATGSVPTENLTAVLTVCEHLMQNESIRDKFPEPVVGKDDQVTSAPKLMAQLLTDHASTTSITRAVAALVMAAVRGSEDSKCAVMDSQFPESALSFAGAAADSPDCPPIDVAVGLLTAVCAAITADDARPPASKAFMNARILALDRGGIPVFLSVLQRSMDDPTPLQAAIASMQALCVNDDICKRVSDGGVVVTLASAIKKHFQDKLVVATACGLLRHLAKSDDIKKLLMKQDSLPVFTSILEEHKGKAGVCAQVLGVLATMMLRHPNHCDALCDDTKLFEQCVDTTLAHRKNPRVIRQACQLFRNLVVRNTHLRSTVLDKGVEGVLREARQLTDCRDVAVAALRDLGLEDYNM